MPFYFGDVINSCKQFVLLGGLQEDRHAESFSDGCTVLLTTSCGCEVDEKSMTYNCASQSTNQSSVQRLQA